MARGSVTRHFNRVLLLSTRMFRPRIPIVSRLTVRFTVIEGLYARVRMRALQGLPSRASPYRARFLSTYHMEKTHDISCMFSLFCPLGHASAPPFVPASAQYSHAPQWPALTSQSFENPRFGSQPRWSTAPPGAPFPGSGTHVPWGTFVEPAQRCTCMHSKAWRRVRVSLRLARGPRPACRAQRSRHLPSRAHCARPSRACLGSQENIIFFNGSKT